MIKILLKKKKTKMNWQRVPLLVQCYPMHYVNGAHLNLAAECVRKLHNCNWENDN